MTFGLPVQTAMGNSNAYSIAAAAAQHHMEQQPQQFPFQTASDNNNLASNTAQPSEKGAEILAQVVTTVIKALMEPQASPTSKRGDQEAITPPQQSDSPAPSASIGDEPLPSSEIDRVLAGYGENPDPDTGNTSAALQQQPSANTQAVQQLTTRPLPTSVSSTTLEKRNRLGNMAKNYADRTPGTGQCGTGVREILNAFDPSLNIQSMSSYSTNGLPSAEFMVTPLDRSNKFRQIDYKPGDIAPRGTVFVCGPKKNKASENAEYGHTAIAMGDGWEATDSYQRSQHDKYEWVVAYEYIG